MEIIWEEGAGKQLQSITDFYLQVAGVRVAEKMLDKIESTANRLAAFPFLGTVETALAGLPRTYRSIVAHPHYKIIYRVAEEAVYITGIWPCRQDPEKLKSIAGEE